MRPGFSPSPPAGEGLGRDPCSAVGATDWRPGTKVRGARAFLPSPLAGEGLGERGVSAEASRFPPLPNPSPARGEGLKSGRSGCGSWVGGRAVTPALLPLSPGPSPAKGGGEESLRIARMGSGAPVGGPNGAARVSPPPRSREGRAAECGSSGNGFMRQGRRLDGVMLAARASALPRVPRRRGRRCGRGCGQRRRPVHAGAARPRRPGRRAGRRPGGRGRPGPGRAPRAR